MEQPVKKRRINYIDMAKGLMICLVVMRHSGIMDGKTKSWFHIPGFFMISGYFLKKDADFKAFIKHVKQSFISLFVPYTVYYIIYLVVLYNCDSLPLSNLPLDIGRYLFGGRSLPGVYWFISCLFIAETTFKFLLLKFKPRTIAVILSICYVVAHLEAWYFQQFPPDAMPIFFKIPWSLDVALLAIVYLGIGYFAKNYFLLIMKNPKITIAVVAVSAVLLTLQLTSVIDYHIDLKYVKYYHIVLDLVIPVVFMLLVFYIFKCVDGTIVAKPFMLLGTSTLSIMYMHQIVNLFLENWFPYDPVWYIVKSITIPLLLHQLIIRFDLTRFLFLGDRRIFNKRRHSRAS